MTSLIQAELPTRYWNPECVTGTETEILCAAALRGAWISSRLLSLLGGHNAH